MEIWIFSITVLCITFPINSDYDQEIFNAFETYMTDLAKLTRKGIDFESALATSFTTSEISTIHSILSDFHDLPEVKKFTVLIKNGSIGAINDMSDFKEFMINSFSTEEIDRFQNAITNIFNIRLMKTVKNWLHIVARPSFILT